MRNLRLIQLLARLVYELDPGVSDVYEVAVVLESLGVSRDTARKMGYADYFELARRVLEEIEVMGRGPEAKKAFPRWEFEIWGVIVRGLMHSIPWVATTSSLYPIALLTGYPGGPERVTMVLLSLITAAILGSGVQHMVSIRFSFYIHQGNSALALRCAAILSAFGLTVMGIADLIIALKFLPPGYAYTHVTLVFPLMLLWTVTGPLIVLAERSPLPKIVLTSLLVLASTLATLTALVPAALSGTISWYSLAAPPIATAALVTVVVREAETSARALLREMGLRESTAREHIMPNPLVLVAEGLPIMLLGVLYSTYVYVDRFVIWGCGGPRPRFDPVYELNALCVLPIILAAHALTGRAFAALVSRTINWGLRSGLGGGGPRVTLRELYSSVLAPLIPIAACVLATLALPGISPLPLVPLLAGYLAFSAYLINHMVLLACRRHAPLLLALAAGLAVNILLSSVLSSVGRYLVPLGLMVGSVVMLALTLGRVRGMVSRPGELLWLYLS